MENQHKYLILLGLSLCAYVGLKRLHNARTRRYKVRPINRLRRISGNYQYYKRMKSWDTDQFFKYTRMTIPMFEKLLNAIKPKIQKQVRSDGISAEERLVITLQYLSQGTSMQALAWSFNLGLTTVHKIIHETSQAIWDKLSPVYLKTPSSEQEWLAIENRFYQRWNFPHCVGAIDGKHITIQAPVKSGSLYFNYKKTFSIILLASCDSQYRFTTVDIGGYGAQSDGGVLRNSVFGQRLEEFEMNLPSSSNLPDSNIKMPYFLVGDEAFPLKEYIMRPYPGKNLSHKRRVFNYRLSRARQVIENTFGILAARWRILKTDITAKVENVDNIVKAVVCLHNYCQTELLNSAENIYCLSGYVDSGNEQNGTWRDEQTPLVSVGRLGANVARRYVYGVRDSLADYLISENGKVPWQDGILNRGRIMNIL